MAHSVTSYTACCPLPMSSCLRSTWNTWDAVMRETARAWLPNHPFEVRAPCYLSQLARTTRTHCSSWPHKRLPSRYDQPLVPMPALQFDLEVFEYPLAGAGGTVASCAMEFTGLGGCAPRAQLGVAAAASSLPALRGAVLRWAVCSAK